MIPGAQDGESTVLTSTRHDTPLLAFFADRFRIARAWLPADARCNTRDACLGYAATSGICHALHSCAGGFTCACRSRRKSCAPQSRRQEANHPTAFDSQTSTPSHFYGCDGSRRASAARQAAHHTSRRPRRDSCKKRFCGRCGIWRCICCCTCCCASTRIPSTGSCSERCPHQ